MHGLPAHRLNSNKNLSYLPKLSNAQTNSLRLILYVTMVVLKIVYRTTINSVIHKDTGLTVPSCFTVSTGTIPEKPWMGEWPLGAVASVNRSACGFVNHAVTAQFTNLPVSWFTVSTGTIPKIPETVNGKTASGGRCSRRFFGNSR